MHVVHGMSRVQGVMGVLDKGFDLSRRCLTDLTLSRIRFSPFVGDLDEGVPDLARIVAGSKIIDPASTRSFEGVLEGGPWRTTRKEGGVSDNGSEIYGERKRSAPSR